MLAMAVNSTAGKARTQKRFIRDVEMCSVIPSSWSCFRPLPI